jgi:uncharacterized protein YukE
MNTQKSIYNKLFKEQATELASHKIDLALLDQTRALVSILGDAGRKYDDEFKKYNSALSNLKDLTITLEQTKDKIDERAKKISSMEKELGLNTNQGKEFQDFAANFLKNTIKNISFK